MSWSFQLHNINQSFERVAGWYQDFLHRTENALQSLTFRITRLEERTVHEPSDEQVERVLRKILAERFAKDATKRTETAHVIQSDQLWLIDSKLRSSIKPTRINPSLLLVDPESVPSRAYGETLHMLEGRLSKYPRLQQDEPAEDHPMAGPSNSMASPHPMAGPSKPMDGPSKSIASLSKLMAGPSNPMAPPGNPMAPPGNPMAGSSKPMDGPSEPKDSHNRPEYAYNRPEYIYNKPEYAYNKPEDGQNKSERKRPFH